MKRNNCIQSIKNQINAKINAQTRSERDYIVFRPKSQLYNPILSKQNNNMTSIFELENKRKNQTFLTKIRCKTKEREQNSIEIDDHLHIQKCKTFKKFKLSKDQYLMTLDSFKTQTPRQKLTQEQVQTLNHIRKVGSSRSQKKFKNSILGGIQKKKKIDSLLLNSNKNNISFEQKQNISPSININRLKPSLVHDQIADILPLNLFRQKCLENGKIKAIVRKDRQIFHKRLQTEIPALFLMKFNDEKPKRSPKLEKSFNLPAYQEKWTRKEQNFVFKPWQTAQIFQKQEEFDQFLKT